MRCARRALACVLALTLWTASGAAAQSPRGAGSQGPRVFGKVGLSPDIAAYKSQTGQSGHGRGGRAQGAGSAVGRARGANAPLAPTGGLALYNAICRYAEGAEATACRATGTPETRYPIPNYALDVNPDDSGSPHDIAVGTVQRLIGEIENLVWLGLLYLLSGILTVLGWALALDPFGDAGFMRDLSIGLDRFYNAFTSPLLVLAFVVLGAWVGWRGLVQRQGAAAVAGTMAALASMLLALVIVHDPRDTVGRANEVTNAAAATVIAAPEGSVSNPQARYAETTQEVWRGVVYPLFATLDFSNPSWALSHRVDPQARQIAIGSICDPLGFTSYTAIANCRSALSTFAPQQNLEVWLALSTGSSGRGKLWSDLTDRSDIKSNFSIQGGDGQFVRFPMVLLVAVGLLGLVLLLGWLALRIFVQTAVAFVLVMAAPLALLFPAFGERGRAAWRFWAGSLLVALLAKLIYSAILSVVLFGTLLIAKQVSASGQGVTPILAVLLMSAFWWAVLMQRHMLLSVLSISDGDGLGALGILGSLYFGARLAGMTGRGVKRSTGRVGQFFGDRGGTADDTAAGTERTAEQDLDQSAGSLGERRLEEAEGIIAQQREREGRLGALRSERARAEANAAHMASNAPLASAPAEELRLRQGAQDTRAQAAAVRAQEVELENEVRQHSERAREAAAFMRETKEAREGGAAFSERQLRGFRDRLRADLDRDAGDGAHHWRAGLSRERYERLVRSTDPTDVKLREQALGRVRASLRRDRAAFAAIPDVPSGAPPRPHAQRDYREMIVEDAGLEGREGLRRAHHDARRARVDYRQRRRRELPPRRGASR